LLRDAKREMIRKVIFQVLSLNPGSGALLPEFLNL
jgi:hypothetical protein